MSVVSIEVIRALAVILNAGREKAADLGQHELAEVLDEMTAAATAIGARKEPHTMHSTFEDLRSRYGY